MPAVRHFVIEEPSTLYAPGLGAVMVLVNDTLHRHEFRLAGQGHDYRTCFLRWQLRGRPYIAAVLRNQAPGIYVAEWRYAKVSLDVLVLPNRVTQVDWRRVAFFDQQPARLDAWRDAMPDTIVQPAAYGHRSAS